MFRSDLVKEIEMHIRLKGDEIEKAESLLADLEKQQTENEQVLERLKSETSEKLSEDHWYFMGETPCG